MREVSTWRHAAAISWMAGLLRPLHSPGAQEPHIPTPGAQCLGSPASAMQLPCESWAEVDLICASQETSGLALL